MDLRIWQVPRTALIVRGQFTVKGTQESAFETLAGVFGELKAKIDNGDTLRYRIDGKSKTTFMRFGTKFHARVVTNFADVRIEVYDIALITSDLFIRELYKTFTKYLPASPLTVDFVRRIPLARAEVDEHLDDTPLPAEGPPEMVADIPDAGPGERKVLPVNSGKACRRCGASNPSDNKTCGKCGYGLINCPDCGHVPEEESVFCIKCGTKLV